MLTAFRRLFILIFLAVGIATATYSLWSCLLAYQAGRWPSVPGVVVSDTCEVAGNRTSARHTRYRYVVGASSYVSDREHFGLRIATDSCVANLQPDQAVVVYYDPADPAQSVLKPGEWRQGLFGLAVGLAFVAFAAVAFRLGRRAA